MQHRKKLRNVDDAPWSQSKRGCACTLRFNCRLMILITWTAPTSLWTHLQPPLLDVPRDCCAISITDCCFMVAPVCTEASNRAWPTGRRENATIQELSGMRHQYSLHWLAATESIERGCLQPDRCRNSNTLLLWPLGCAQSGGSDCGASTQLLNCTNLT